MRLIGILFPLVKSLRNYSFHYYFNRFFAVSLFYLFQFLRHSILLISKTWFLPITLSFKLFGICNFSVIFRGSKEISYAGSFHYDFDSPNFSPLQKRYRRGIDDDNDDMDDSFRLPKDVKVLEVRFWNFTLIPRFIRIAAC